MERFELHLVPERQLDLAGQFSYSPRAMVYLSSLVMAIWLLGTLADLNVAGAAPSSADRQSATGLLVLRNGNVIQGKVQRFAEHYRVELTSGEMQIRVEQVAMFCQSWDEAYERRRERRTGSTADSHIELARWCLQHDLLEYASRELLDVRTIDPQHRQLTMLERRLRQALRLQSREPARHSGPAIELPSKAEKDSAHSISSESRASFVRHIQPMLVQSCATSGCHQPNSGYRYQLNRLAVEGVGHPGSTLGNLASTLERIDSNHPDQSKLLLCARTPHGSVEGRISKTLQPHQLKALQSWTLKLGLARSRNEGPAVTEAMIQPLKTSAAQFAADPEAVDSKPRDPFDPAIFNERFASKVSQDEAEEPGDPGTTVTVPAEPGDRE